MFVAAQFTFFSKRTCLVGIFGNTINKIEILIIYYL